MSRLFEALALAQRGFHVFPLGADRTPAIKDFPNRATRDEAQIRKWWGQGDRLIGVSTTRFGADQALLALDVDVKKGKRGDASLLEFELAGLDIPPTVQQRTPSGGRHYVFTVPQAMKQSVEQIAPGLDIRSRGGYIVAYDMAGGAPAAAPQWLVDKVGYAPERPAATGQVLPGVDPDRAYQRALEFLRTAPTSVEGEGGDITAYKVAAKLKDMGCSLEDTFHLMADNWNDRCSPPWSMDEIAEKVEHAFRYGKEPVGSSAPEAVFEPVMPPAETNEDKPHPVAALNDEFAFIKKGAFVLQETTDEEGRFATIRLSPPDLHQWFANKRLQMGDKSTPLSQLWMRDTGRREYDSVVFSPAREPGGRFYNLWRGFSVQPKAGGHPALAQFLDHALANVCKGDQALCKWLMGYFAHMIQRPWDKPLVALVFRGSKGTGKNALVERVGWLLGPHFMVADDDRYLLGNFNAHLEANLFFVLDEASWAGDKRAEGRLKGLITGSHHNIERKGFEAYKVRNLTRVSIIGNEKWLVPATFDERRFAVFDVGNGRRQDRAFFESMRVGMEQGGYAHLLHYLQTFDLAGIDVNAAPRTAGLMDQVRASLPPAHEWWMNCLDANELLGSSLPGPLPERMPTERALDALHRWAKGRNVRTRLPGRREFAELMAEAAPSLERKRARIEGEAPVMCFINPGIGRLRKDWDAFLGESHKWEEA